MGVGRVGGCKFGTYSSLAGIQPTTVLLPSQTICKRKCNAYKLHALHCDLKCTVIKNMPQMHIYARGQ